MDFNEKEKAILNGALNYDQITSVDIHNRHLSTTLKKSTETRPYCRGHFNGVSISTRQHTNMHKRIHTLGSLC